MNGRGIVVIEIIAASTAAYFGIKFIVGRKYTMMQNEHGLVITYRGDQLPVPYDVQHEIMKSVREVQAARGTPVLQDIITQEAERIRDICHRRKVQQESKLRLAVAELFNSEHAMQMASHNLQTIDLDRIAMNKEKQARIETYDDEKQHRKMALKREEMELRKMELELQEQEARIKNRQSKQSSFGFSDFGSDEGQEQK